MQEEREAKSQAKGNNTAIKTMTTHTVSHNLFFTNYVMFFFQSGVEFLCGADLTLDLSSSHITHLFLLMFLLDINIHFIWLILSNQNLFSYSVSFWKKIWIETNLQMK